jgi:hypothetical protein
MKPRDDKNAATKRPTFLIFTCPNCGSHWLDLVHDCTVVKERIHGMYSNHSCVCGQLRHCPVDVTEKYYQCHSCDLILGDEDGKKISDGKSLVKFLLAVSGQQVSSAVQDRTLGPPCNEEQAEPEIHHNQNGLETLSTERLRPVPDFNNYGVEDNFSYWDQSLREQMRLSEAILLGISESLQKLGFLAGPLCNTTGAGSADKIDSYPQEEALIALWPVVHDVAAINLRLDNYVFYFDLNSHKDPFGLISGMACDTANSLDRLLGQLRTSVEEEDPEWFEQNLKFNHYGLAFLDKKLVYDIERLQAFLARLGHPTEE